MTVDGTALHTVDLRGVRFDLAQAAMVARGLGAAVERRRITTDRNQCGHHGLVLVPHFG
ncbi:MAG: hypothetical protein ACRDU8_02770 [Egibacteraceae bacterium]